MQQRKKILIYSFLLIAPVFGFGIFIAKGLFDQLKKLDQTIRLEEKEYIKFSWIQNARENIFAQYNDLQGYFQWSGQNEKDIFAELLKEVERLVQSAGGSIINLTPQEDPVQEKDHASYLISFRLEQTFFQMTRFLSAVKESRYLIRLDKLSIMGSTGGSKEDAFILKIEGMLSLSVPHE